MPRCKRCGDEFVRATIDQVHCIRCAVEVAAIITSDARRRVVRFRAKDLSPWGGAA